MLAEIILEKVKTSAQEDDWTEYMCPVATEAYRTYLASKGFVYVDSPLNVVRQIGRFKNELARVNLLFAREHDKDIPAWACPHARKHPVEHVAKFVRGNLEGETLSEVRQELFAFWEQNINFQPHEV